MRLNYDHDDASNAFENDDCDFTLSALTPYIEYPFFFSSEKFSDKLMQFLSNFWPNHLPKRMEIFRNQFEFIGASFGTATS